jgi:hypothetical protein
MEPALRRLEALRSGLAQAALAASQPPAAANTADIADLEVQSSDPNLTAKAAEAFHRHGCVVIRGLNDRYVPQIRSAIEHTVEQSRRLESQGKIERVDEGWVTPDGTLFIPASHDGTAGEANRHRPVRELVRELGDAPGVERQIMVPAVDYQNSAALFQCANDSRVLDIVSAIFGAEDHPVELFGNGQLVYKEPQGGHIVSLHQDAAFFEFGGSGLSPIGTLNYCVDTTNALGNGPLTVFPGSHRGGFIEHVDSASHLGLDPAHWQLENGISIDGKAGDSILFNQYMVHGSPPNHSRYVGAAAATVPPLGTTLCCCSIRWTLPFLC